MTTLAQLTASLAAHEGHERAAAAQHMLVRANTERPDEATLAELRAFFDAYPDAWHMVKNLTARVLYAAIDASCRGAIEREALYRHLQAMRDDLGYAAASPMERTLIDHIVLCWLRLQTAERDYTAAFAHTPAAISLQTYAERRLHSTQARYLRAVDTLARVRRLTHPQPVQVNIASQQVNQAIASPRAALQPR
jgi:hypothetical protein